MLALAEVVAVRWTSSRVVVVLVSLPPCRVYSPAKGADPCPPCGMFATSTFLIERPFQLVRQWAFRVYGAKVALCDTELLPQLSTRKHNYQPGRDPIMRPALAGAHGWDGQVFDVDHIAGVWKEEAALVRRPLLSGSGYVPGCTSAEPVILT